MNRTVIAVFEVGRLNLGNIRSNLFLIYETIESSLESKYTCVEFLTKM